MSPIEEYCLEQIKNGAIRLDQFGGVEYFSSQQKRWILKSPQFHPASGRKKYAFNREKFIYANRLIWMIANKQSIPESCFIDHKDGNRLNDAADNVQLHLIRKSNQQGGNVRTENTLEKLSRWFEFVGNYGREPMLPLEITLVEEGF
jgi:hypothetical protein